MEQIINAAMAAGMTRDQATEYATVMLRTAESAQVEAGRATALWVNEGLGGVKTAAKVAGLGVTNFLSGMLRTL